MERMKCAAPFAMRGNFLLTTVAFLLLALPRIGASSALVLIDNTVTRNNDEGCFPTLFGSCLQGRTAHNRFLQLSNTAFDIRSFANVDIKLPLVPGQSWVQHDYTHRWQVGLDAPAGSQGQVWLDAVANGVVSTYGLGLVSTGNARAAVGLRLWQGAFTGWGYYYDPVTGNTLYGPMLADGTVTEPNLDWRRGERVSGAVAWSDAEVLSGNLHELLDFTLTSGDPTTHLWIEAFLSTYAEAVELDLPKAKGGDSNAEVDLWSGDKGFRYSLALNSTVPEPGTLALLGLGLAGLGLSRRRRAA